MSFVMPFRRELPARSWSAPADSEGTGFRSDPITGAGTRETDVAPVTHGSSPTRLSKPRGSGWWRIR